MDKNTIKTTEFECQRQARQQLYKRLWKILAAGWLAICLATVSPFANAACEPAPGSSITELPDFACLDTGEVANLYASPVSYRIMRKGKRIGTHNIQVEKSTINSAELIAVSVKSRIRVTMLKVPVFTFNYQATEIWEDGTLQKVEAVTTENSKKTAVSAVREGVEFVLQKNDKSETVSGLDYSSNHWNPAVLRSTSLFNTLTGKKNSVELEKLGVSQLDLPVGSIEATHFRYSGDLQAEVWYDNNGRWLQLRFEGNDGSVIFYQLEKQAS